MGKSKRKTALIVHILVHGQCTVVLPSAPAFPPALTSTAKPSRARYIAAVLPAGPAPTTTAFLPAYSVEGATAVAVVEGTEAEDVVPPGATELRRRQKSEGA